MGTLPDLNATREKYAIERITFRRDHLGKQPGDWRPQSQAFFHTSMQIQQRSRFGILSRTRNAAIIHSLVNFRLQAP